MKTSQSQHKNLQKSKMGGPRKRTEPPNCQALKQNEDLWSMFENVGMASFFQSLKGYNESLMEKFTNSWRNGWVSIGAVNFEVMSCFIARATGLHNTGLKVFKKSGVGYQRFIDNFLHNGEKLKRFQNGYARLELPPPFSLVSLFVMHYFTLEGRYMFVHAYHFPLLNHIRHGECINFHFYLMSSM